MSSRWTAWTAYLSNVDPSPGATTVRQRIRERVQSISLLAFALLAAVAIPAIVNGGLSAKALDINVHASDLVGSVVEQAYAQQVQLAADNAGEDSNSTLSDFRGGRVTVTVSGTTTASLAPIATSTLRTAVRASSTQLSRPSSSPIPITSARLEMDGDDGYDDEDNDDDDNEEKPERRRLLRRSAHRRLATRRQVGRGRARGTGEHLDRRGVSGVGKQVGQVSTSSRIAESNADLSLNLIGPDGQNLIVTQQCAAALPLHSFRRAHRQDAAFIAFQAWLIGLAVVAVWSASVPHLVALLVAKTLATTFAFVELQLTISFHALFDATINNGACSNTPFVLSNYWSTRAHINIAIATIELVSLLLAAFIAWKLRADLGWRTWKLLGADCQVARVHAVRLAFATTCQLALFFLLCLVAVWVNELVCDDTFYNAQTTADGIVSDLSFPPDSNQAHVFIALLSVLAAAIPIWAYLGISGASRGSRVRLGAWFAIAIVIALSALIMLIDPAHLFSHALDDWAFLLALALISAIVLTLAIGLGAVVWLQMGSDAARQDRETSTFIRSRDVLDEDVHGDAPSFDEKAAFEHHEEKIAPDAVVIPFPPAVQRAVFNVPPTRVLFPQHFSVSTMRTFPTTPEMDATPRQSTVAPTSPSAMTNSSDGWLDRLHQPGVLPAAWMPQPTFDSRWSESSLARTAVTDDSVATRHW